MLLLKLTHLLPIKWKRLEELHRDGCILPEDVIDYPGDKKLKECTRNHRQYTRLLTTDVGSGISKAGSLMKVSLKTLNPAFICD